MRRRALAFALVAACGGGDDDGACPPQPACTGAESSDTETVVVARLTLHPFPGLLAFTSRADGSLIARGTTDAEGCARLPSEPGALVTVVFNDQWVRPVTTLAPTRGRVEIYGERVSPPPDECRTAPLRVTGTLAPPPGGRAEVAVSFGCDLVGCAGASTETLPLEVTVPGLIVGDDGMVDAVLTHCLTTPGENGSFRSCSDRAYRVRPGAELPLRLDELAPEPRAEDPGDPFPASYWAEADGREFPALFSEGALRPPAGLVADHLGATSVLAGADGFIDRWTWVRRPIGDGARPVLTGADFLPEVAPQPFYEDDSHASLRWTPPALPADVVHLQFRSDMPDGATGYWNFLLPPDADHVRMPSLPELPWRFVIGHAHFVDDDGAAGFADFLAGGVRLDRGSGVEPVHPAVRTRLRVTTSYQSFSSARKKFSR